MKLSRRFEFFGEGISPAAGAFNTWTLRWGRRRGRCPENAAPALVLPGRSSEKHSVVVVGTEAGIAQAAARRVPKAALFRVESGECKVMSEENFGRAENGAEQIPERAIEGRRGLAPVSSSISARTVFWVWSVLHFVLFAVWRFLL
jgi:hypothetical protein